MPISYPTNCRVSGDRDISFEVDVDGDTIYGMITCEAVLGIPSASIGPDEVERALRLVERDHSISLEVADRVIEGDAGERGSPVFLSSIDFPRRAKRA